jgi:hypothetical protein
MRYLDVAVALMVGTAALAGIAAWGPGPGDALSAHYRAESAVRAQLLRFVDGKGVAWFAYAPAADICAAVLGGSNSTFGLDADVGSAGCGAPPPPGSATARLSFSVGGKEVNLSGWTVAGG